MPCRVVWPILDDIRGFPDAASIRNWRNHCQTRRYAFGAERAGSQRRGTRWRRHGSHSAALFDARVAALTGAVVKRNRLVLDPGMGFFLGAARNLALGAGAVR